MGGPGFHTLPLVAVFLASSKQPRAGSGGDASAIGEMILRGRVFYDDERK
jgi:hypothetical protein